MTEKQLVSKHYAGKRTRVTVETGDKTLVEQHHRETTNINNIIGRYRQSGQLPPNTRQPQYADVSNVGELLDVHQAMSTAQEMYEELPESVKEKFTPADLMGATSVTMDDIREAFKIEDTDQQTDQPGNKETQKISETSVEEPPAGEKQKGSETET